MRYINGPNNAKRLEENLREMIRRTNVSFTTNLIMTNQIIYNQIQSVQMYKGLDLVCSNSNLGRSPHQSDSDQ